MNVFKHRHFLSIISTLTMLHAALSQKPARPHGTTMIRNAIHLPASNKTAIASPSLLPFPQPI
jgi:hypothetical protein